MVPCRRRGEVHIRPGRPGKGCGGSANFALTAFSEVGIAPVSPLAPYGGMLRLPRVMPGGTQPAAIVSSALVLARTLQARPARRRRRRGFVPLLAACSGGINRPDQGGKDVGWGEDGTSGVGDVTALAEFSKGVPYTLPPCVRAGLGDGFAERSGYAPWQAERRHRGSSCEKGQGTSGKRFFAGEQGLEAARRLFPLLSRDPRLRLLRIRLPQLVGKQPVGRGGAPLGRGDARRRGGGPPFGPTPVLQDQRPEGHRPYPLGLHGPSPARFPGPLLDADLFPHCENWWRATRRPDHASRPGWGPKWQASEYAMR